MSPAMSYGQLQKNRQMSSVLLQAAHVSVAHVDLPENDWGALSKAIQSCAGSYVHVASNVSSQTCASSFYTQCFPDASVSLGWSGQALLS